MMGKCLICDVEILKRLNGAWEDLGYHSITFLESNGYFLPLPFCKSCHDAWDESKNEELLPKILKHIEECVRQELKKYENLKIEKIVCKDGPLSEEEKDEIQVFKVGAEFNPP